MAWLSASASSLIFLPRARLFPQTFLIPSDVVFPGLPVPKGFPLLLDDLAIYDLSTRASVSPSAVHPNEKIYITPW